LEGGGNEKGQNEISLDNQETSSSGHSQSYQQAGGEKNGVKRETRLGKRDV